MARWRSPRRSTTPATRLVAVLGALAVTGGSLALPAAAATAATAFASDAAAAAAGSHWLAGRLEGGLLPGFNGPDYGLSIDAVFAMYASGNGSTADPIVDQLAQTQSQAVKKFITLYPWGSDAAEGANDRLGGSVAKALVAAEVSGRDPRAFGGYDLVKEMEDDLTPSGPQEGRVRDHGPNTSSDNSNTFGQALAVIGLAGVSSTGPAKIDQLLSQQCQDGYFRIFFGATSASCQLGIASGESVPDGDSTGIALSAMLAARRAGASGLDDPIGRAVAWLVQHQQPGGGWSGGASTDAPNTNSTGLVVQALADAGADAQVIAGGAAYLRSAQADPTDAATAMKDDIGAIGYQPADLVTARTDGITTLDTWIRAGTQASLGLSRTSFWRLVTHDTPPPAVGTTPPPVPAAPPVPRPAPSLTAVPPAAPSLTAVATAAPPAPPVIPLVPTPPRGVATPTPPRVAAKPCPRAPKPTTSTSPGVVVPAGSATPAGRTGHFLAASLVAGDHVEVTKGATRYVDYDATADTILALRALGEQPETVARASAFLLRPASVAAYAHGAPYEKTSASYAAPLAKLAVIADLWQRGGTAPAGVPAQIASLVRSLETLQGSDGTFEDTGTYADRTDTTQRQAWATMALTALGAGSAADRGAEALVRRQCTDGGFATSMVTLRCTTGDPGATGWAAQALDAVRAPSGTSATAPASIDPASIDSAPTVAGVGPATGWPSVRTASVQRAAARLYDLPTATGLVTGKTGSTDLGLTAVVAAGRRAVGLDTSDTTRTLGGMLRPDGGFALPAAPKNAASDLPLTLAAADGLAGRSWTASAASPLGTGVRVLALGTSDVATTRAAPLSSPTDTWWRGSWALLVGALLAFALGVGAHALRRRPAATSTTVTSQPGTAAPGVGVPPPRPTVQTREESS